MKDGVFSEKTSAQAFPLYASLPIDKSDSSYRQNVIDWTDVLKTYEDGLEWCASQGKNHYEERHKERGLLLGTVMTVARLMQLVIEYDCYSMQTLRF